MYTRWKLWPLFLGNSLLWAGPNTCPNGEKSSEFWTAPWREWRDSVELQMQQSLDLRLVLAKASILDAKTQIQPAIPHTRLAGEWEREPGGQPTLRLGVEQTWSLGAVPRKMLQAQQKEWALEKNALAGEQKVQKQQLWQQIWEWVQAQELHALQVEEFRLVQQENLALQSALRAGKIRPILGEIAQSQLEEAEADTLQSAALLAQRYRALSRILGPIPAPPRTQAWLQKEPFTSTRAPDWVSVDYQEAVLQKDWAQSQIQVLKAQRWPELGVQLGVVQNQSTGRWGPQGGLSLDFSWSQILGRDLRVAERSPALYGLEVQKRQRQDDLVWEQWALTWQRQYSRWEWQHKVQGPRLREMYQKSLHQLNVGVISPAELRQIRKELLALERTLVQLQNELFLILEARSLWTCALTEKTSQGNQP